MSSASPSLEIKLLGGLHVTVAGADAPGFHQPRLQALLAYLLIHRHAPRLRQELAFLFWPDSGEAQARTNLRKLLHMLRGRLPTPDAYLHLTAETVQWRPDAPYTLDVAEFQHALRRAAQPGADAAHHWAAALRVYRGDLLPGHYDDWVLTCREELRDLAADVLRRLIAHHHDRGELAAALQFARQLLAHDPLHEETHRTIIGLHLELDDRAAALRAYHACATLLREELGVDPSPATEALYQAALQADATPVAIPDVPSPSRPRATLPFVGRHGAHQQLLGLWQRALDGVAYLAIIQGEPGMGKTRLAAEVVDSVQRRGHATAYARAFAAAGAGAYAPVIDLLRTPAIADHAAALPSIWRSELARLLPELHEADPNLPTPPPMLEAWQQRRLHEAIARACMASGKPLLIHLDDLQWCDNETFAWLHFFLRFAADTPLLIIGTLRDNEVDPPHPSHRLAHDLLAEGRCLVVPLTPLGREDMATLANAAAEQTLDDVGVDRLETATEGNPLFVIEMVRSGRAGSGDGLELPPRVHAVIMQRLEQLSPAARRAAEMAAVMGRQFTYPVLQRAYDGNDDLLAALDELWQRRIIREQGTDAYDFSHDRIREATYESVRPVMRRAFHAQAAAALADYHAHNLDGVSSQIAAHYAAAGERMQAIAYYRRAAANAASTFANNEALRLYQAALDLLPAEDWATRFDILLARERILDLEAESPARVANLEAMQALLDDLAPGVAFSQRAQCAIRHSQYLRLIGRPHDALVQAEQGLHYARLVGDPGLEVDAYTARGYAHWGLGEMVQAQTALGHAIRLAHAGGDGTREATARELSAQSGMFSGMSPGAILEHLHACLAIHQRLNNHYGLASIYNKLGYLPMAQGEGEYAQALRDYQAGLEIAARMGALHLERNTLSNMGYTYMLCGMYAEAERDSVAALEGARAHNDAHRAAAASRMLGVYYRQIGDFIRAEPLLVESIERCRQMGARHWMILALVELGALYVTQARYDEAHEPLTTARDEAHAQNEARYEADALVRLGHLYLALQNYADAHEAYAAAYTLRMRMEQFNRALEAQIGLAEIAAHCGDHATAHAELEAVVTRCLTHKLDCTDESLRIYVTAARLLAAYRDPQAAHFEERARAQLHRRAATLADVAARRLFWAAPDHAPFAL